MKRKRKDGSPRRETAKGKPDQRGGKMPGAGRPFIGPEPVRLVGRTVTLAPRHWDRAEELGGGNASNGLRTALDLLNDISDKKRSKKA